MQTLYRIQMRKWFQAQMRDWGCSALLNSRYLSRIVTRVIVPVHDHNTVKDQITWAFCLFSSERMKLRMSLTQVSWPSGGLPAVCFWWALNSEMLQRSFSCCVALNQTLLSRFISLPLSAQWPLAYYNHVTLCFIC